MSWLDFRTGRTPDQEVGGGRVVVQSPPSGRALDIHRSRLYY
jgi:hypothetical protein